MKNVVKFLSFIVVVSQLLSGIASALPVYITVQGSVGVISTDAAGIIAEAGYDIGSILSFTLAIDLERGGTITYNDTSVIEYVDPYGRRDFFAEYISGDILQEKDGGFYNAGTDVAQCNYGQTGDTNAYYPDWFEGCLTVGSSNSFINLMDIRSPPEDWHVGGSLGALFTFVANDSLGNCSSLMGMLDTITYMGTSAPVPVPEPSTMLLLGTGLAALLSYSKKRRS